MGSNGPTVTGSAAIHAERIRAGAAARAERPTAPAAGQSTAERYAQRILPGYRADEEARERARLSELRARGVISAEAEPEDEEEYEDEEDVVEEVEEEDEPVSTAEIYARRERLRIKAEHKANLTAHRGSTWALGQQAARII